jgi:drug/metabolite transporter (DMT)-like permease
VSAPRTRAREEAIGGLLVGSASVLFGCVVIFGKFALRRDITVPSMLALRFGLGGLLLAAALVVTGRPLRAASGEGVGLALLAVGGYAVEATFFFTAVEHGTAAAVTLLFFTYPVVVTLGTWALGQGPPARLTLLALASAVGGAAVVAGTGGGLAIEAAGVAFALAAAVTYSGYLIGADALLRRTNPMTSAMWVSAGASAGLLAYALVTGQWMAPGGWSGWWPVIGMGVASAGAFVCLMAGLRRLGAVRTAIVAASEPLSAAFLALLFLGEKVSLGTALGGALILTGAVTASVARATTGEQQIP